MHRLATPAEIAAGKPPLGSEKPILTPGCKSVHAKINLSCYQGPEMADACDAVKPVNPERSLIIRY